MSQTGAMTLALGIDLGSTTTKVALVDVARAEVRRIGRVPTPDGVGELLDVVAELVRGCLAEAPGPVAAIGIASMAETGAPADADGRALLPLQRWDRTVRSEHLERVLAEVADLPHRTGLPATPKPPLVTLRRLREDDPDAFSRIARWQGVADLVAHALTGAHATDHTLAARTMLIERGAVTWSDELLAAAGIAGHVLPAVRAPGERAGRTDGRAATFGLASGIPVHIAGHDHAVGAWAAGVRRPGDVADSLGTAEAVLTVTQDAEASAVDDGFSIGRTVDGRHDTIMGGSPACGSLLADWPGAIVDRLAAEDPARWVTSEAVVLPYPRGRQCPSPDSAAQQRIVGSPVSEGDLARGVLQSLVLHARWMRRAMAGHSRRQPDRVVMLGSLAVRIRAWAPLAAAADEADFDRCLAAEPVAAGAALLAAAREGVADDDRPLATTAVTPADAPGIDAAYERFVAAALSA